MTGRRRVCAVTGSRADYGLLLPVLRAADASPALELEVAVTGAHLAASSGFTHRQVEADDLPITARVAMLEEGDSALAIGTSIGRGVIGFSETFARREPDLLLVIGDRYETLAAAQAALVAQIPIVHIGGGEVTEGVYDDAWRHALTKMAHVHLVTTAEAARRVRQLGEEPSRVHVVGNPGLDAVVALDRLDRASIESTLGFQLRHRNLLLTFHPTTRDPSRVGEQTGELLAAVERLGPEVGLLFTHPTADRGAQAVVDAVEVWVAEHENARAYRSLGHRLYLSCMAIADAVVGNSSSGLYEAPALRTPAVNIGDRQKGRLRAASVIDCAAEADAIEEAIRRAFTLDCSGVVNPYGDGKSAARIVAILEQLPDRVTLLAKRFIDEPHASGR